MDNSQKEIIREVFSSVRPYLNSSTDLEEDVEEISENSSDLEEFEDSFEEVVSEEVDSSRKTDYRIFLNKLRSR